MTRLPHERSSMSEMEPDGVFAPRNSGIIGDRAPGSGETPSSQYGSQSPT